MPNLLTVREAAALVRLSPETLRRMCAAGEIVSYRHGKHGHYRIVETSLMSALQRHSPDEPMRQSDLKAMGKRILAEMRAEKLIH